MTEPVGLLRRFSTIEELVARGGEGSGHFGHEGRPGQRGGSAPSEGGKRYEIAVPERTAMRDTISQAFRNQLTPIDSPWRFRQHDSLSVFVAPDGGLYGSGGSVSHDVMADAVVRRAFPDLPKPVQERIGPLTRAGFRELAYDLLFSEAGVLRISWVSEKNVHVGGELSVSFDRTAGPSPEQIRTLGDLFDEFPESRYATHWAAFEGDIRVDDASTRRSLMARIGMVERAGNAQSGNWGHAGRPGQRGGSLPGGGHGESREPKEPKGRTTYTVAQGTALKDAMIAKTNAQVYTNLYADISDIKKAWIAPDGTVLGLGSAPSGYRGSDLTEFGGWHHGHQIDAALRNSGIQPLTLAESKAASLGAGNAYYWNMVRTANRMGFVRVFNAPWELNLMWEGDLNSDQKDTVETLLYARARERDLMGRTGTKLIIDHVEPGEAYKTHSSQWDEPESGDPTELPSAARALIGKSKRITAKELVGLLSNGIINRSAGLFRRVVPLDGGPFTVARGGPGSGHFGHEGRPGERGGSQPGEGGGEKRYSIGHDLRGPRLPEPQGFSVTPSAWEALNVRRIDKDWNTTEEVVRGDPDQNFRRVVDGLYAMEQDREKPNPQLWRGVLTRLTINPGYASLDASRVGVEGGKHDTVNLTPEQLASVNDYFEKGKEEREALLSEQMPGRPPAEDGEALADWLVGGGYIEAFRSDAAFMHAGAVAKFSGSLYVKASQEALADLKAVGGPAAVSPMEFSRGGQLAEGAPDEMLDAYRDIERARWDVYKLEMGRAVCAGDVSEDEANAVSADIAFGQTLTAPPETLWHVSTNADAIVSDGIKSRVELAMLRGGVGLAGGPDETISFSDSFETAKVIERTLTEAQMVASGALSFDDLLTMAHEGTSTPEPFLGKFISMATGGAIPRQDLLDAASQWEQGQPIPQAILDSDWYRYYTGNAPEKNTDRIWDAYHIPFLHARQNAGGPENPVLFGTDYKALANLDPDKFRILEYRPANEHVRAWSVGGLGEWRFVGGENVELVGQTDYITPENREAIIGKARTSDNVDVGGGFDLPLEAANARAEGGKSSEAIINRGGPGSGHFGHLGRPGERGGSQPGEGGQDGGKRYAIEGRRGWQGSYKDHAGAWSEWSATHEGPDLRALGEDLREAALSVRRAGLPISLQRRQDMGLKMPQEFVHSSKWVMDYVLHLEDETGPQMPAKTDHDGIALYRLAIDAMRLELDRLDKLYADDLTNPREVRRMELDRLESRLAEFPATGTPQFIEDALSAKGASDPSAEIGTYDFLFRDNPTEAAILQFAQLRAVSVSGIQAGTGGLLLKNLENWGYLPPHMADTMRQEYLARNKDRGDAADHINDTVGVYLRSEGMAPKEAILANAVEGDQTPWSPQDEGGPLELVADVINSGWQSTTAMPTAVLATEVAAELWGGTPVPRTLYDEHVGTTWVYPELVKPTGGLVADPAQTYWLDAENRVNAFYASDTTRAKTREVLEQMDQRTQDWFERAGYKPTETIRLYRGVKPPEAGEARSVSDWNPSNVESGPATVNMYSLSSWSLSPKTAVEFAHIRSGEDTGWVIAADVPVSRILATASTGFSCQYEHEFIVKGNGGIDGVIINQASIPMPSEQMRYGNLGAAIRLVADDALTHKSERPQVYPDLVAWRWIAEKVRDEHGITPEEVDAQQRRTENIILRGGPTSGHWGHKGRPGERGGSLPGEGGEPRYEIQPGGHMASGFKESDIGEAHGVQWRWEPWGIAATGIREDPTFPGMGMYQQWRADITLSQRPPGYRVTLATAGLGTRAKVVVPTLEEAQKVGAEWVANLQLPGEEYGGKRYEMGPGIAPPTPTITVSEYPTLDDSIRYGGKRLPESMVADYSRAVQKGADRFAEHMGYFADEVEITNAGASFFDNVQGADRVLAEGEMEATSLGAFNDANGKIWMQDIGRENAFLPDTVRWHQGLSHELGHWVAANTLGRGSYSDAVPVLPGDYETWLTEGLGYHENLARSEYVADLIEGFVSYQSGLAPEGATGPVFSRRGNDPWEEVDVRNFQRVTRMMAEAQEAKRTGQTPGKALRQRASEASVLVIYELGEEAIVIPASEAPEPVPGKVRVIPLGGIVERGGEGSGHWGHKGRPGERGGSIPGDQTGEDRYMTEGRKRRPKVEGAVKGNPRALKASGSKWFGKAPDDYRTALQPERHGPQLADAFERMEAIASMPPDSPMREALKAVREAKTPAELSKAVEKLEVEMLEAAQPGTPTRLRYLKDPDIQEAWKAVDIYREWAFFNDPQAIRDAYGGYHPADANRWAFAPGQTDAQEMAFQYTVGSAMLEIADMTGFRVAGVSVRDHIPQAWVKELVDRGKDPSGLRGGFDPKKGELVLPPYAYQAERDHTIRHELTHVVDDASAGVEGHSPFGDGIYASTMLEIPSAYAERVVALSDIYETRSDVSGEFVADSVAGLFLNKTAGARTGMLPINEETGVLPPVVQWLRSVHSGDFEKLPIERGRELAIMGHQAWEVERAMTKMDGTRIFIRTLDNKGGYEMLFKPDGPFLEAEPTERGGPGSGHFGHEGRPGQRGGSQPGEGGGQGEKRYMAEKPRYLAYKGNTKDSPKVKAMASELYGRASTSEPKLSAVMEKVVSASGGKAHGWDFRQKSEKSIAEKIVRDSVEKDIPLEQAASEMNDLNRYTVVLPPDTFVEQTLKAQAALEEAGFQPYDSKAKNYFTPGDDYDGYNTVYWDPRTGERFELQFHTEETAVLKEEAHIIYNDWRELPTDHPERTGMWERMVGLWKDYARPVGYERLPGRLMVGGAG